MTWRSSSLCFLILVLAVLSELPSTSAADLICAEGYTQDPASGTCRSSSTLEQEVEGYDSDYGNESALELENELNVYNLLDIVETVEQELPTDPDQIESVQLIIDQMNEYLDTEMTQPNMERLRALCVNKERRCAFWASIGECDVNPGYMKIDCALACQSCDHLDIQNRCPLDPNAVDVWKPGDLNTMFQRIAYGPESSTRQVQVLSEPSLENKTDKDGPWVVVIDDFISEVECKRLIELGAERGYERSRDVGEQQPDGTFSSVESKDRTSKNAWCQEECLEDEVVQVVLKKIENLTGIPDMNSEHLQLLKYEEGEFYKTHHDFIDYQVDRACGPRIITAFLYLNDVEAGGGTNFPELNLTVMPARGRILLWPSVLDHDLYAIDPWTYHQALPVEKGIKYGANGWLHLRDFKTPNSIGCA